ncbi:hypothetical protein [Gemmatimonas sp.]|uniref:hypothetical protein n=1 Tax=Gemmatimonas sp. TaxID=1962908 RepID=UPI0022CCF940|nr:hypothetical protein [Gemmatimonas sp.]MCZ8205414.1 hypothetical protein [Gemmatimonas sp.]
MPETFEPRPPSALVGHWERQAPASLRGDTLTLNADSTASGLILWEETKVARAKHWTTRFGSRKPAAERQDWREGYEDGGEPECVLGLNPKGCVSLPMICIGALKEQSCQAFTFVAPDSLLFPDGSVFVRIKTPPVVALSQ